MKAKHPKIIKALNFLEDEKTSKEQWEQLYREFYACNKCQGGGNVYDAIDYHIENCIFTNSTKE